MHGLETIIALNNRTPEPVTDEELAEIIELWSQTLLAESWLDRRIWAMAQELQWRRSEMRGQSRN